MLDMNDLEISNDLKDKLEPIKLEKGFILHGKYADAKITTNNVDEASLTQISNLINQPFAKNSNPVFMPDVHAGKGCTIGTTMKIEDKICPNLVGVDISCGMLCINLGDINIDLEKVDNFIKENIPCGFNVNESAYANAEMLLLNKHIRDMNCFNSLDKEDRLMKGVGSLGGGNHFIEIDVDTDGNNYLIIHSGSRNFGNQVATIWQKQAIQECSNDPERKDVPKELSYLQGESCEKYLQDMDICKEYANMSRRYIAQRIIKYIFSDYGQRSNSNAWVDADCKMAGYDDDRGVWTFPSFETLHNYINTEEKMLRKGAISCKEGEEVLIPLNMRDGSLICVGKGNKEWNSSGPHGAGRILSRAQAKKKIDVKDFKKTMEGIYSTTVNESTIDESPFAYKPADEIENLVGATAKVVKRIKPIYNFKASE